MSENSKNLPGKILFDRLPLVRGTSSHHELLFASLLLLQTHPLLVFLEIFPLRCLKVEPGVGEGLDVRQESFYEGMKLVLKTENYSSLD